jgi:hypothetical protein
MNPELLAAIVEKNSADVETIVAKIGVVTLLQLSPNLIAILKTIQEQQAAAPK